MGNSQFKKSETAGFPKNVLPVETIYLHPSHIQFIFNIILNVYMVMHG